MKAASQEYLVLRTRAHGRKLIFPALICILLGGLTTFATGYLPRSEYRQWLVMLVYGIACILFYYFCVVPYMRWLAITYEITSRRVRIYRGFLQRKEIDAELSSMSSIEISRSILQRLYGRNGDIILHFKGHRTAFILSNVPEAARFREIIRVLITTENDDIPEYETREGTRV